MDPDKVAGAEMIIGLRPILAFLLLSGSVAAQDWSAGFPMRTLERPSHEALMSTMNRSGMTLSPFETDGCSGGLSQAWDVVAGQFPDFAAAHSSTPPWEECCITHDRAYHNAGDTTDWTSSFEARLTADLALKSCVISVGTDRSNALADIYNLSPDQIDWAYENIADAMYSSVRIGGAPCSGFTWRWGYGFPQCSVFLILPD